nr:MAG TPA: hypothetical protein [Caudoviricetes sp.]
MFSAPLIGRQPETRRRLCLWARLWRTLVWMFLMSGSPVMVLLIGGLIILRSRWCWVRRGLVASSRCLTCVVGVSLIITFRLFPRWVGLSRRDYQEGE